MYDASQYEDKEIQCVDGVEKFIWTANDQAFYAEKGFNAPKRCKEHAAARRAKHETKNSA